MCECTMIWQRPTGTFEIERRPPWAGAEPIKPPIIKPATELSKPSNEPAYRSDFELKQRFGALLAKGLKPFEAAIQIFDKDTSAALWVSTNWINDPVVQSVEIPPENLKLLDKEALAAKVLAFAEEKDISKRFYINESPERLKALELYAKICGFVGQTTISVPINNDNRTMNIKLVSPEKKIDNSTIIEAEIKSAEIVPLRGIKLVS